ncbi:FmdB family zinc ribbon protein [Salinisphaera hydrothermalis]|nr:zinc ribbon domain-containing protein [Salinisphaera hydrothermalis]
MPIYEYRCPECGPFETNRRMSECDAPADCPVCKASAGRIMSAPRLAVLDAGIRHAHATNERSAHSPRFETKHEHSAGCGCGTATQSARRDGIRTRTGHRPWMISH